MGEGAPDAEDLGGGGDGEDGWECVELVAGHDRQGTHQVREELLSAGVAQRRGFSPRV